VKLNANPTLPGTKPRPPSNTLPFVPATSFPFPSAGHHETKPDGADTHCACITPLPANSHNMDMARNIELIGNLQNGFMNGDLLIIVALMLTDVFSLATHLAHHAKGLSRKIWLK
jgi:hypothetical protein